MKSAALQFQIREMMQDLERCGFQPVGDLITQGSGAKGKALSADGTTWVEFGTVHLGFRESLRLLLKKKVLRSVSRTVRFTTEFNDGTRLVTTANSGVAGTGVRKPAGAQLAALVQQHLCRLDHYLRVHHPVKPLIYAGIEDFQAGLAAARRMMTPAQLEALGVAPHLARLIAGPFHNPTAVLLP